MQHTTPAPIVARRRAVALLIDGENLPAVLAGRAILAARQLGALAVLRVFGDAARLGASWHDSGVQPIHARAGKNVTDMALTVAAMDLSYAGTVDGFVLGSADRDFAPLVWSLRSRGFPVWGLSPGPMPAVLAAAFTHHVALAPPGAAPVPSTAPEDPRLAAVRAVLASPKTPAEFGHAMMAAGFARPEGSARWQSWLGRHAPFVRIAGTGRDRRFALA